MAVAVLSVGRVAMVGLRSAAPTVGRASGSSGSASMGQMNILKSGTNGIQKNPMGKGNKGLKNLIDGFQLPGNNTEDKESAQLCDAKTIREYLKYGDTDFISYLAEKKGLISGGKLKKKTSKHKTPKKREASKHPKRPKHPHRKTKKK